MQIGPSSMVDIITEDHNEHLFQASFLPELRLGKDRKEAKKFIPGDYLFGNKVHDVITPEKKKQPDDLSQ